MLKNLFVIVIILPFIYAKCAPYGARNMCCKNDGTSPDCCQLKNNNVCEVYNPGRNIDCIMNDDLCSEYYNCKTDGPHQGETLWSNGNTIQDILIEYGEDGADLEIFKYASNLFSTSYGFNKKFYQCAPYECTLNINEEGACDKDASEYGSNVSGVNYEGDIFMKSNRLYEKTFCLNCRNHGETLVQSQEFIVKVDSCANLPCLNTQFFEFRGQETQKQTIIGGTDQFHPYYKLRSSNSCCPVIYKLTLTQDGSDVAPVQFESIYTEFGEGLNEQIQFQIKSEYLEIPWQQEFYLKTEAAGATSTYKLQRHVHICNVQDITITKGQYQNGLTDVQMVPIGDAQTKFVLPEFLSSSTNCPYHSTTAINDNNQQDFGTTSTSDPGEVVPDDINISQTYTFRASVNVGIDSLLVSKIFPGFKLIVGCGSGNDLLLMDNPSLNTQVEIQMQEICDESQSDTLLGINYRGCQSHSQSGKNCIAWESKPYRNKFEKGTQGTHNYCRNPSSHEFGIFCFVLNSQRSWEECDRKELDIHYVFPQPVSLTGSFCPQTQFTYSIVSVKRDDDPVADPSTVITSNQNNFSLVQTKFQEQIKFVVRSTPVTGAYLDSPEITINITPQDCSITPGLQDSILITQQFNILVQNEIGRYDYFHYKKIRCDSKRCCAKIEYDLLDENDNVITADVEHIDSSGNLQFRFIRRLDRQVGLSKIYRVRAKNTEEYIIIKSQTDLTWNQAENLKNADTQGARLPTFQEIRQILAEGVDQITWTDNDMKLAEKYASQSNLVSQQNKWVAISSNDWVSIGKASIINGKYVYPGFKYSEFNIGEPTSGTNNVLLIRNVANPQQIIMPAITINIICNQQSTTLTIGDYPPSLSWSQFVQKNDLIGKTRFVLPNVINSRPECPITTYSILDGLRSEKLDRNIKTDTSNQYAGSQTYWRYVVPLDIGQDVTIWVRFKVVAKGGQTLVIEKGQNQGQKFSVGCPPDEEKSSIEWTAKTDPGNQIIQVENQEQMKTISLTFDVPFNEPILSVFCVLEWKTKYSISKTPNVVSAPYPQTYMVLSNDPNKLTVNVDIAQENQFYTFSISTNSYESDGQTPWPIQKLATDWQVVINVDFAFNYPQCISSCLNNGKQIKKQVYKIGNQCYISVNECVGCLENPSSSYADLKTVICPKRCDSSNKLKNKPYGEKIVSVDIQNLPTKFDLAENLQTQDYHEYSNIQQKGLWTGYYSPLKYANLFSFVDNETKIQINNVGIKMTEEQLFYVTAASYTCLNKVQDTLQQYPRSLSHSDLNTVLMTFKLKIYNCAGQMITLKKQKIVYEIQKNHWLPHQILNEQETFGLFQLKDNDNCNITSIDVIDQTRIEIPKTDSLYDRLYLDQWKNWSLSINTTIDTNEVQKTLSFTIRAQTDGGNLAYQDIEVRLGCFAETSISAKFVDENINRNWIKYPSQYKETLFDIDLLINPQQPIYQLNIGKLLRWFTSHDYCGVSILQICDDPNCEKLSNGINLQMESNPIFKNKNNGLMPDLILNVTRSEEISQDFYIKGFAGLSTTVKVFKVHLDVSQIVLPESINDKTVKLQEPLKKIEIAIKQNIDGQILNQETSLNYISPKVVCDVDQTIEWQFEGYDKVEGLQIKKNDQNQFVVQLNYEMISQSNSGYFEINIKFKSSKAKIWNQASLSLDIKFEKEKKIEVPDVVSVFLDKLKAQQKSKTVINKNQNKNIQAQPPKIYFEPISRYGDMILKFDQDMVVPPLKNGKIDQNFYNYIFNVRIISVSDYSIVDGEFETSLRRDLKELESQEEDLELSQTEIDLQFNVEVTEHLPRRIQFKINLKNPSIVSSTSFGLDSLSIQLKNPAVFISAKTGMQIDMTDFLDGIPEIRQEIRPQIQNQELADSVQSTTAAGGLSFKIISSGNLILGILLGGVLQQLWGTIRAMQTIVFLLLIQVPFPAITNLFFIGCMEIASIDVIGGEDFYENNMVFQETTPHNVYFNNAGIETKLFMPNSASFVILQLLIFLWPLFKFIMNKFMKCLVLRFRDQQIIKDIGIWASPDENSIKYASQKLFFETYFDICMCSILNIIAFYLSKDVADFGKFWSTRDNIINSSIAVICFVFMIIFPIYGILKVHNNYKSLELKENKLSFGVYYEDVKTDNYFASQYHNIFLIRKLIMTLVFVFLNHTFFQSHLLLLLSLTNIIYLVLFRPFKNLRQNRIEQMNEMTVLLVHHMLNTLIDPIIPQSLREQTGMVMCMLAGLNITINLILTMFNGAFDVHHRIVNSIKQSEFQLQIDLKIQNRMKMVELGNPMFKMWEYEIEFYQAQLYCKWWSRNRKWLKANDIQLSNFQAESDFQMLMSQFCFLDKAKSCRKTKEIDQKVEEIIQKKVNEIKIQNIKLKVQKQAQFIKDHENQVLEVLADQIILKMKTDDSLNEKQTKETPLQANDQLLKPQRKTTYQIYQNIVAKSKEMKMEQIKEESSDEGSVNISSEEEKDILEIKTVKLQEKKKLYDSELRFYNPQAEEQNFSSHINIAKLKNLTKAEEYRGPFFKNVRNQIEQTVKTEIHSFEYLIEKSQHGSNNLNEKNRFRLDCINNLEFLLDDDPEIVTNYGQEFEQQINKDHLTLINECNFNDGIVIINAGPKNDFISMVLQIIVENVTFKMFFLNQSYLRIINEQDKKLCQLMHSLFIDIYKTKLPFLTNKSSQVFKIVEHIKEQDKFKRDIKYSTTDFFKYYCQELIKELNPDGDLDEFTTQRYIQNDTVLQKQRFINSCFPSIIDQQFIVIYAKKFICLRSHTQIEYESSFGLNIEREKTVRMSIENFFGARPSQKYCQYCEGTLATIPMKQYIEIVKLPPTLVLFINLIDQKQCILFPEARNSIPAKIPLNKYMHKENISSNPANRDQKLEYNFFAGVLLKGKSLQKSEYKAVIKRNLKSENRQAWFEFQADSIQEITNEEAIHNEVPQILFYRKNEQE